MASLAGRELPADVVQQISNLTMGQLFFMLGHIQKLSAQQPVTAQALLAENPQLCHALLHAECLAGMIEEPMLPMTAEELRQAKDQAHGMQADLEHHELPHPEGQNGTAPGPSPSSNVPEAAATAPGALPAAFGAAQTPGFVSQPPALMSPMSQQQPLPGPLASITAAAAASGAPVSKFGRGIPAPKREMAPKLPGTAKSPGAPFLPASGAANHVQVLAGGGFSPTSSPVVAGHSP